MNARSVLVQPVSLTAGPAVDRRNSERHPAGLEALARPLDTQDSLWWGAQARDISASGIGLSLCYPFRPGTLLAVDLKNDAGGSKTLLTRVVHVEDKADGTWLIGCEFVKKLTDSELEMMI